METHNINSPTEDISVYFKGTHEVEGFEPGKMESNPPAHMVNCKKNPGHTGFIPVQDFTIDHLPADLREKSIFKFVQALADITVRVCVAGVSKDRPDVIPDSDTPYPFSEFRGQDVMMTGSGRIEDATKYDDEMLPCHCEECKESGQPCRVWGQVDVITARHVVFDQKEADNTSIRFWYDDEQSDVVTLEGWTINNPDTDGDWCSLSHVTHDEQLIGRLDAMYARWREKLKKLNAKYEATDDVNKLVVLVSHPHGCAKRISIGRWVHKQMLKYDNTRYTYTACSCPGSSGAYVYRLGCTFTLHTHSGSNTLYNFSGVDYM
ncbi:uncharacterized protein LOC131943277 [Physella acuta]|uniref:uncharacterized protein LOC131943277 n=1 Tax=Physella acuta TaxID=109671 RepID=UPI0027DE0517|nr:uncharacterized protein LOC131943277 [Physella acuta]